MPSPLGDDELDRLFDLDNTDSTRSANGDTHIPDALARPPESAGVADFDEEIKFVKSRRIVAKLDETRLRSANGVPKLKRSVKALKFKGKGHEFSNMNHLLHTYQFWLDELFPKAKFADGLSIIETLGHKMTVQRSRVEWIDEERHKLFEEDIMTDAIPVTAQVDAHDDIHTGRRSSSEQNSDLGHVSMVDSITNRPDIPDDGQLVELTALTGNDILQHGANLQQSPGQSRVMQHDHGFADDEEAMAELGW